MGYPAYLVRKETVTISRRGISPSDSSSTAPVATSTTSVCTYIHTIKFSASCMGTTPFAPLFSQCLPPRRTTFVCAAATADYSWRRNACLASVARQARQKRGRQRPRARNGLWTRRDRVSVHRISHRYVEGVTTLHVDVHVSVSHRGFAGSGRCGFGLVIGSSRNRQ